mgnify:CR=1 FL=1
MQARFDETGEWVYPVSVPMGRDSEGLKPTALDANLHRAMCVVNKESHHGPQIYNAG